MSAEGLSRRFGAESAPDQSSDNPSNFKGPRRQMQRSYIPSLLIAIAIPLGAGFLDSIVFSPNTDYYKDLKKPSWNPPNAAFAIVWTILYIVIGVSSWLVWRKGGFDKQAYPLTVYAVQLVFNLLWTAIFFGFHKLFGALVDISLLLVAIIACILAFKPVSTVAANLLIPYLAWVAFATALNAKIYMLNS
eukprot:c38829_g1_i1 orf=419-988(-)